MFGRIIGDIVAAPVRIANIPIRVAESIIGEDAGIGDAISEVADTIDDATAEALGEDD